MSTEKKDSQTQPDSLLETIDDAFMALDKEWRFTYLNKHAEQLIGKPRDELIGKVVFDVFPQSFGSHGHQETLKALQQNIPISYEQYSEPLDRWFSTHIYPMAEGIVVYFKDITEHKRAEEKDHYLAMLLESISDAVLSTDTEFRIVSWNQGAERLYGWSADEVRGKLFPSLVNTEYLHRSQQEAIDQIAQRGRWRDEVVQTCKNGTRIHVLSSVTAVQDHNKAVVGYVAVNRDITHRKQAEEARSKLAAIVESTADPIIGMLPDGTITSWNQGAQRLYGWTELEVVGRSVDLLIPDDRKTELEMNGEKLRRGERIEKFETVRVRKDGVSIPVSLTISPIIDNEGNVVGISTIARDITNRMKIERLLQEQAKQQKAIADLGVLSLASESAQHVLHQAVQLLTETLRVKIVKVLELLPDRKEFVLRAGTGWNKNIVIGKAIESAGLGSPAGYAVLSKETVIIEDLRTETRFEVPQLLRDHHIVSGMSTTISFKGQQYGVLGIYATEKREFTQNDVQFLQIVANILGMTLDREHSDHALRESEERFRQLAQTTHVIPWEADGTTGQFTYVGPQAEQLLGYPAESWYGPTFWPDHIHPDDREEAVRFCLESLQHKAEYEFDYRMIAADGNVVWFHDIVNVSSVNGKKVLRGFLIDITQQKQDTSEREVLLATLQQQQQRMDNLMSSVPGVVWEAWGDPDERGQRINFVSEHVEAMLGYTVAEWLATPNFWLTIVHPADKERAAKEAHDIYQSGEGGVSQFRWLHKDGNPIWVEAQSVVVKDASGNPIGMRGVTMDISSRKEQEVLLNVLGESSKILSASLSYEETLNNIAEVVVPEIADWCSIQIVDDQGKLQQVAVMHPDPAKIMYAKELREKYPPKLDKNEGVGKVIHTGKSEMYPYISDEMIAHLVKERGEDKEYLETIMKLGLRSAILVPIATKEKVQGVITLIYAESGRRYNLQVLEVAEEIGRRAAAAIENAHLYREREKEIAERKLAFKALTESEGRFRSLVEQSVLAIQIMTPDGYTIQVNEAWEELWGVKWEDFKKMNYNVLEDTQLVEKGMMPYIKKAFAGEAQEIPPSLYDPQAAGLKGTKRWTESFIYPVKDEKGKIKEVVLLHEDITARVQAEELSRERTRQQSAAAQLSIYALANTDERAVMNEAVSLLTETLNVEYAKILELLPGGSEFILRAGVGWDANVVIDQTRISAGQNSQSGYTLHMNEPVIVRDLQTETRFSRLQLLKRHDVISGMSVVIYVGERPYGVLGIHSVHERTFTEDDLQFVQLVANILAMTLERKHSERALRESEDRFKRLADDAPVLIWMTTDHVRTYFNRTWLEFTGRSIEEEKEEGWLQGIHPDELRKYLNAYRTALEKHEQFTAEYRLRRADGEYRWMLETGSPRFTDKGAFLGYIGSCMDITEHKQNVETIRHQALHDSLTTLPNRKALEERLTKALAEAQAHEQIISVMFLDIDNFKLINDTYGHTAGDIVLKEVGARFRSCVRDDDTVARLGGDEFIIMLAHIYSIDDVLQVADRIFTALQSPVIIGQHSVPVSTSIGITVFPTDGSDIHTLLKNADRALYRAKEAGKNRYHLYNRIVDRQISERFTLESELRDAIKRNELVLHYQPIIHTQNKKIVSVEALVRWNHPRLGLIYPNEFIPVAEAMGLIVPLGEWVMREACKQNKAWQEAGLPHFAIAVNLSPYQFAEPDLIDVVKQILMETGLDPACLELEITESVAMGNLDHTINTLNELVRMGVHITLDDFGTGYSSLSYLKRFPVHNIKVDQSFIRNCLEDEQDAAIIKTIITMAYSLGLKVIAEGVEKEEQAEFLHTLNCHRLQGYLVQRPVPADKLQEWLLKELELWEQNE